MTPADVAAPHGAFLVAHLDGDAVGCGAIKRFDDRIAEVKRVWVEPSARGRGVGRAIMAALHEEALDLGYDHVRLETGIRQPEAMQLYEALGYERIEPYGHYRDSPHTACYQRALRPSG